MKSYCTNPRLAGIATAQILVSLTGKSNRRTHSYTAMTKCLARLTTKGDYFNGCCDHNCWRSSSAWLNVTRFLSGCHYHTLKCCDMWRTSHSSKAYQQT